MSKIVKIIGREVLDSRGYPTVEVEAHLEDKSYGRFIVPSGKSKGINESLELRDNDLSRYLGKGVLKSVFIINNIISKEIIGLDSGDQKKIDNIMIDYDGTYLKSKLGANSMLAVSLAIAKANSNSLGIPLYQYISKLFNNDKFILPIPMVNIINGGCHADNNIDIQEFMIQPVKAKSFRHAIRICSEIFHNLSKILKINNKKILIGDEGGYAPDLSCSEEALIFIKDAIEKSGYILGKDIFLALDCASSRYYNKIDNFYLLEGKKYNFYEITDFLNNLIKKYHILSIEDPLSELDWDGYIYLSSILNKNIQIIGDDLFVTNINLFKKGIKLKVANSILIKPNQIGTLTETLDVIKLAKKNNYFVIISHRSGETEDTTIADLAVGTSSNQIKTGSMSRSERICKYNRLIRIEEYLGSNCEYKNIKKFNFLK